MLLGFGVLGISHLIYPDYFIKRTAMRRGEEMLNEWNRTGVRFVGLIVTLFSGGILYDLVTDLFSK
jgi:hypothetical protein